MNQKYLVALTLWILIIGPVYASSGNGGSGGICGDNITDIGQQCDNGPANGDSQCDENCFLYCGNNIVQMDKGQQCDDGNRFSYDGCDQNCQIQCGNGFIQGFQQCDPGISPVNCGPDCKQLCGNGVVDAGQQCDDGHLQDGDGCNDRCRIQACGNGRVDAREQCDDGNLLNGDGCDQFCFIEPICGDGIIQFGQECDDGNLVNGDGCNHDCIVEDGQVCIGSQCFPVEDFCGNGVFEPHFPSAPGEGCDDGNKLDGDGCSSTCHIESGYNCDTSSGKSVCTQCGNSVIDSGQACDDSNLHNGDGCSSDCVIQTDYQCSGQPSVCVFSPQVCGDGKIQGAQQCDDYNLFNGDGCSSDCIIQTNYQCSGQPSVCTICGDGKIQGDQQCDDYNLMAGDGCSQMCVIQKDYQCTGQPSTCVFAPYCGNGQVQPTEFEECDDNNTVNGDGCDANCFIEDGYQCTIFLGLSICQLVDPVDPVQVCGNGIVQTGQQCDDNNINNGDGCDYLCKIEDGYSCQIIGGQSSCTLDPIEPVEKCGDGTLQRTQGQICDDGNTINGDGCDSSCQIQPGWLCNFLGCFRLCGNGRTESQFQEQCDDGNTFSGDGCDLTCKIQQGWQCSTTLFGSTRCVLLCGNGFKSSSQQCDDGNGRNGDGCSTSCIIQDQWQCTENGNGKSVCTTQTAEFCGNAKYEPTNMEQCDDGNMFNTDGCTNTCQLDPNFECTNVVGQKTVCGVPVVEGQICKDPNFPLPGRTLKPTIVNALANSPFTGITTIAGIVAQIVSTQNGVTKVDAIRQSILQRRLLIAGLQRDWNTFSIIITLCAGNPLRR